MLSNKEKEFLGEFSHEMSRHRLYAKNVTAVTYLFSAIECKFGSDMFEFMINYYSSLLDRKQFGEPDNMSLFSIAGNYCIGHCDESASEINNIIADKVYDKFSIDNEKLDRNVVDIIESIYSSIKQNEG